MGRGEFAERSDRRKADRVRGRSVEMTIAGFAAVGMNTSRHFVMGGGTTQEFILIVSFVALGLVLIYLAVGACTRCRPHACAARYTSPRR